MDIRHVIILNYMLVALITRIITSSWLTEGVYVSHCNMYHAAKVFFNLKSIQTTYLGLCKV